MERTCLVWYGGHHNAIGGKHRPGHGTMEFQPGFAATAELGEYLRGFTKHVGDIFVKMRGCVDALWRQGMTHSRDGWKGKT